MMGKNDRENKLVRAYLYNQEKRSQKQQPL